MLTSYDCAHTVMHRGAISSGTNTMLWMQIWEFWKPEMDTLFPCRLHWQKTFPLLYSIVKLFLWEMCRTGVRTFPSPAVLEKLQTPFGSDQLLAILSKFGKWRGICLSCCSSSVSYSSLSLAFFLSVPGVSLKSTKYWLLPHTLAYKCRRFFSPHE